MRGASIITAILYVISIGANAYEFEKVDVREDGTIVNESGKVIALPNMGDKRNTEYHKFYYDASKKCQTPPCDSDFSIILHPELGYIKAPDEEFFKRNGIKRKDEVKEDIEVKDEKPKVPAQEIKKTTPPSVIQYQGNPYDDEPDMRSRY